MYKRQRYSVRSFKYNNIEQPNRNRLLFTDSSVDRDDLRDGGAAHFAACVRAVRAGRPGIVIETLTPDFRGRMDVALAILEQAPPDVFNHNLETVPRLYRKARPGADYQYSLELLRRFKERQPRVPTKSGFCLLYTSRCV